MPRYVSFWLVPAAEDRRFLQDLIDTLARTHAAPTFTPHVTIYSGVWTQTDNVLDIMDHAARSAPRICLQVDTIRYSAAFTKTLFVQFHPSSTLRTISSTPTRSRICLIPT